MICEGVFLIDYSAKRKGEFVSKSPPPRSRALGTPLCREVLARWRHRKQVVEDVWKRWDQEYVGLLENFHENKQTKTTMFNLGQVVIIYSDRKPNLFWKLGRIEKLNVGRDGNVRLCVLKVLNEKAREYSSTCYPFVPAGVVLAASGSYPGECLIIEIAKGRTSVHKDLNNPALTARGLPRC